MSRGLASRARSVLGPRVSARYLRFLTHEQYEQLDYLHLDCSAMTGWFLPSFRDHRSLFDMARLARVSGVAGLTTSTWRAHFPNLAPLAVLEPVHPERPGETAGGLLAMGLQPDACAVFLVTRLENPCVPVAKSLDAFIRGQAWRFVLPSLGEDPPERPLAYRWSQESNTVVFHGHQTR